MNTNAHFRQQAVTLTVALLTTLMTGCTGEAPAPDTHAPEMAPTPAPSAPSQPAPTPTATDDTSAVTVRGQDGWLFLTSELQAVSAAPFWGEHAASVDEDPLNAIVDLHRQLKELNVQLILCPAPPRAVIYADKLPNPVPVSENGAPQRSDAVLQEFYQALEAEGVTVVDVTQAFLDARKDDATLGTVSCRQDTHWSPRGLTIAARAVADVIMRSGAVTDIAGAKVQTGTPEPLTFIGDLVALTDGHPKTESTLKVAKVTAGGAPFEFDTDNPVLLLADSHGLVFSIGDDMHCSNAGFGELLSASLGFPIDVMARRGSGDLIRRDLARRFIMKPEEAAKKKVLVYTFAARTFAESKNWKVVPLKR